jgi:hypothetical protein
VELRVPSPSLVSISELGQAWCGGRCVSFRSLGGKSKLQWTFMDIIMAVLIWVRHKLVGTTH